MGQKTGRQTTAVSPIYSSPLFQKADAFAHAVYDCLDSFPPNEQYGLVSQLRRCVISVPSNIVEGYARQRNAVFTNHLEIAYGSLMEAKYQLYFACKRSYISVEVYTNIWSIADKVGKMLWKSIETTKKKNNNS